MAHFIVRWKRPRKIAPDTRLSFYAPIQPPPGPSAQDFPAWKAVESNRAKFSFKLQAADLSRYPASPEVKGGIAHAHPHFKVKWRPARLLKRQAEFPPITGARVLASPYPSWKEPEEAIRRSFDIRSQSLPLRNDEVAAVPPEPGVFPSWKERPSFKFSFKINNQILELDQWTPTLGAPDPSDILTGWLLPKAFGVNFEISRVPNNESFNAANQPPIVSAGFRAQLPDLFRYSFKRRHLTTPDLLVRPATPGPVPPGNLPVANGRPKQFKINFERLHLKSLELNSYPSTNPAYYIGYYPGSGLAKSSKVSRRIKLQSLPELNRYPLESRAATLPAFARPKTFKIGFGRNHLVKPEHNEYPVIDPAFYTGWYPGSGRVKGFRVKFDVKLQTLTNPLYRPLKASFAPVPALISRAELKRHGFRNHVTSLELDKYPPFVVPPVPARRVCYTEPEHRFEMTAQETRNVETPRHRRK